MDYSLLLTGLASALAFIGVGGAFYEFSVVDHSWPKRPEFIQPDRGGISRKRFWIPAHSAFEIVLLITLVVTWSVPDVRFWLLIAVVSHAAMRIWSAFDFIPKAVAFESADPQTIGEADARTWSRRSLLRLPLASGDFHRGNGSLLRSCADSLKRLRAGARRDLQLQARL